MKSPSLNSQEHRFPFAVAPDKLRRILKVCEEHICVASRGSAEANDDGVDDAEVDDAEEGGKSLLSTEFKVKMAGGKRAKYSSIDDLLGSDNTRSASICELRISVRWYRPDRTISIDFTEDFGGEPKVEVSVWSDFDSAEWVRSTLSSVMEQVMRTRQTEWPVLLKNSSSKWFMFWPATLGVSSAALIQLFLAATIRENPTYTEEKTAILSSASSAVTVEEKVDVLYRLEMLRQESQVIFDLAGLWTLSSVVMMGLLGLIVASLAYLWVYCYPKSVYLWGDVGEEYERMKKSQIFVWGLVVSGMSIILSMLVGGYSGV